MAGVSLLEYLALRMNCEYLSDLRYASLNRSRLRYLLCGKCGYEVGNEAEWLEVCRYVVGEERNTGREAYERLIQFCEEEIPSEGVEK